MSTSQEDDPALEKLREDYLKQLLDRYEARSGRFRSLLFGFTGFGIVFILLVLIPFANLRRQRQIVSRQVHELQGPAQKLAEQVDTYKSATQGFKTLQSTIGRGADELRAALPALTAAPSMGSTPHTKSPVAQQQLPSLQPQLSPCGSIADNEARINCRVADHVRKQFEGYAEVLNTAVLETVTRLPEGSEGKPDSAKLQSGLGSIHDAFEARLKKTPRFWKEYSEKVDFYSELRQDLDRYWKEFGFQSQEEALV